MGRGHRKEGIAEREEQIKNCRGLQDRKYERFDPGGCKILVIITNYT